MIFTNVSITVKEGKSTQDNDIYIYRGDRNIEVRFTIESPFRYTDISNLIEDSDAYYAQLVIKKPNSEDDFIYSSIEPTEYGVAKLMITAEMIDETIEVGEYDYQIILYDESINSRVTIPPIIGGIKLLEPISLEVEKGGTYVNEARVGYAILPQSIEELETFDENGKYNKTDWKDGDLITDGKLNKIEDALDKINASIISGGGSDNVDLSAYALKTELPTKTSQLTNDSNFLTSIPSEYITETELTSKDYATKNYVTETINDASMSGGYTHPTTHPATMITGLSTVATSGSYNDLSNKPTIPTVTNDLTNTLKSNYNTAYTHSQSAHAPSNAQKNSDITKTEIEAKLTGDITSHTHSQYLTEHQSLEGYATKEWVEEQGFIVEIPNIDLTNYATRQFVLDKIAEAQLNNASKLLLFESL